MTDEPGDVWIPASEWRLVTAPKKCRRPRCYRQAVAEVDRGMHTPRRIVPSWWAYCDDHLYGHRIHGGKVWTRVRDGSPAARAAVESMPYVEVPGMVWARDAGKWIR